MDYKEHYEDKVAKAKFNKQQKRNAVVYCYNALKANGGNSVNIPDQEWLTLRRNVPQVALLKKSMDTAKKLYDWNFNNKIK